MIGISFLFSSPFALWNRPLDLFYPNFFYFPNFTIIYFFSQFLQDQQFSSRCKQSVFPQKKKSTNLESIRLGLYIFFVDSYVQIHSIVRSLSGRELEM